MYLINEHKIELLDPKEFGLDSHALIGRLENEAIVLLKDRKSRIIMKDGKKILEQIEQIRNTSPKKVAVATTSPVCSKTTQFFKENNIELYNLEKKSV